MRDAEAEFAQRLVAKRCRPVRDRLIVNAGAERVRK